MKLTIQFHLVPRLRMSGVMPSCSVSHIRQLTGRAEENQELDSG